MPFERHLKGYENGMPPVWATHVVAQTSVNGKDMKGHQSPQLIIVPDNHHVAPTDISS